MTRKVDNRKRKRERWGTKASGAKGLPSMTQVMAEKRKPGLNTAPFTMEDKLQALELYAELGNADIVATKMNRNPDTIRKYLWRYKSTTKAARLTLEAGSERLANRIVKDASVEEALEVMDRLDVLSAKREKAIPQSTSVLIIGMPGHKDHNREVPMPSQKQIAEAIDAQVIPE